MTDPTTPQAGTTPTTPAKGGKARKLALIIGVPALMLVSCATGAMTSGKSDTAAPPTPTKTIHAPAVTKTIEHTRTVTSVPNECMVALERADSMAEITGRFATSSSEAMTAAANMDAAKLSAVTEQIRGETDELRPIAGEYATNRDACRAAR